MVQIKSIISTALSIAAASAQTQYSLLTPIDYEGALEVYYYFRSGEAVATLSNEGISVEGSYVSREDTCRTLVSGQIVYKQDDVSTLLTSNCYNVFFLVDPENQPITWDSCEEFPFFEEVCGSIDFENSSSALPSSATTTTTTSQHSTATAKESSIGAGETLVLSTVTTTVNDIITTYTTWCPITTTAQTHTDVPLGHTTITKLVTKNGIVGTETITSTVSAICGPPASLLISDIQAYESSKAAVVTGKTTTQKATQTEKTEKIETTSTVSVPTASATVTSETATTTKAEGKHTNTEETTVLVGGGSTAAPSLVAQQTSSAPVISTFAGQANRVSGSLGAFAIIAALFL